MDYYAIKQQLQLNITQLEDELQLIKLLKFNKSEILDNVLSQLRFD